MNQPCDASVVEQSPVKENVPAPTQKSEVTQVSLILPFVDSPVVFFWHTWYSYITLENYL